ncbi:hypothetical protein DFQ26_008576 [Actinomortierella ambigua]|nr:hypothetical protein DFQ26_008576 [Actinomortierella ambigua]
MMLKMVPSVRPASVDDSLFNVILNLGSSSSSTPSSPIASSTSGRLPQDLSRTQPVTMTIFLPPSFPEVPPRITIFPTVRHLYVDGSVHPAEVTGHEKLKPDGWFTYANLGALVKELVDSIQETGVLVDPHYLPQHHHLNRTGSSSVNSLATSMGSLQLNNNSSNFNNTNHSNNDNSNTTSSSSHSQHHPPHHAPSLHHPTTAKQPLGHMGINGIDSVNGSMANRTRIDQNPPSYDYAHKPPPPIPARTNSHTAYGGSSTSSLGNHGNASYATAQSIEAKIVLGLTQDQVTELLESPIAFEHFVNNLKMVAESRILKREWWAGNDNVARRTLAMEAELRDLHARTTTGYEEAVRLQQQLEEKLRQQQDALWRFKPENMHSRLRTAMAESEELSDSVQLSYLEDRLDTDSFIRQYRELRKVYHMRGMKNERLASTLKPLSTPSASLGIITGGPGGGGSMGSAGLGHGSTNSGSLVNGAQPAPSLADVESARTGNGGSGGGGSNGNGESWVVL